MKKSTKAALLSAFIFPGTGHLFLKKYIQAVVLAGTAFAASYYLISKSVERALQIVEKIESGDITPDVLAITELLEKQAAGAEAQSLDIAMAIIIICWLIGIVDAYRLRNLRDKPNS
ncbi:MAG: hypothetical protein OEY66_04515 [Gammaproteobacteria bacterium]|nr:hypothetical protein [Gammaproteobacteria bacterium]